jgi:hypothetical protein
LSLFFGLLFLPPEQIEECFVEDITGADPGFQVRGAHLKQLRRAKGGAKFFGVFRVKNHDFTPKNHIFSNFRGGGGGPPGFPPSFMGNRASGLWGIGLIFNYR